MNTQPNAPPDAAPMPRTGCDDLDSIHSRLGDSIAALRESLHADAREAAMRCAAALMINLRADFSAEESLMRRFAYPDIALHETYHAEMELLFGEVVRRVRDVTRAFDEAARVHALRALNEAVRAFSGHVNSADRELCRFLACAAPL